MERMVETDNGLTLGGGFGLLSRNWGLTVDNLLEVELVDANGNLLRANSSEQPDLFWACRGGSGSFGIVTAFAYRAHPIGSVVQLTVSWPFSTIRPPASRSLWVGLALVP